MYHDPNGEEPITASVFIGSALIGGITNVYDNQSEIHSFVDGVSYFLNGASGGLFTPVAPAANGFITEFSNSVTRGESLNEALYHGNVGAVEGGTVGKFGILGQATPMMMESNGEGWVVQQENGHGKIQL
jgi:hypothetical protein